MPANDQSTNGSEAAQKARDQAAAHNSLFAPTEMTLVYPDDTTEVIEIPPHPNLGMLDEPQLEAYRDLVFEVNTTYDRHPDIILPEQKLDNGIVIPAETKQGALKFPYQRTVDGKTERVKPDWEPRAVEAALGEEKYGKIKAAKKTTWPGGEGHGSHADVWRIWNEKSAETAERQDADPKSVAGRRGVASVS